MRERERERENVHEGEMIVQSTEPVRYVRSNDLTTKIIVELL